MITEVTFMSDRGFQPQDFDYESRERQDPSQKLVDLSLEEGTPKVGPTEKAKSFSFATEDIVALGALILCAAAGIVAVIIAMALAFRSIDGNTASKIILGCVGSGAVGSVVAKLSLGKKKKQAR